MQTYKKLIKLFCIDRVIQPMEVLQESGYTLKVRSQRVSLQPQDPESLLRLLDESAFQSVRESKVHPMFLVKVLENERNSPTELKMQLSIHEKNSSSYVILKQDISTVKWNDITNFCTIGKGIYFRVNPK